MTALERLLTAKIAADGPITLADYMAACLLHPEHGYYTTRDPFGAAGDFVTAPDISQMYGELLGLCLAQSWLDQGSPASFALVELGPGRGTLMADALRATRHVPGFHAAASVWLVEVSPALRAIQRVTLASYNVNWCNTVQDLPGMPVFLVANEFFDALPVRQFTRTRDGWTETMVGIEGGRLHLQQTPCPTDAALAARLADTGPGDVVELCLQAAEIASRIAQRIQARGGLAVIVDYGDWGSRGDTVQAVRAHAFAKVLTEPGRADITAHVDFAAIAAAAQPCAVRFATQGTFLTALGIGARSAVLAEKMGKAVLSQHNAALRRLTDAAEMGTLFKVLAIHPANSPPPPGFA